MIRIFKIDLILYLLLLLIIARLILSITPIICFAAYNSNHDIFYKKHINDPIDINKQIKELIQISDAHSQCLIQLQQQLSENQQDIAQLRGYIQDMQHHIAEIINDQKESYKQLQQEFRKNNNNNVQFSYDATKASSIRNESHKNSDNHVNKSINHESEIAYKTAVELVLEKKQYIQAIQAFQDFIKKYPKSNYQSNAHYWLGQLYYNQGNKHDASYHFAWVVKNYSKSPKAPDALLKIGIIMQETNQIDKAKTIYKQIIKLYPNTDAFKQAQKRLLHLSD